MYDIAVVFDVACCILVMYITVPCLKPWLNVAHAEGAA